MPIDRRITDGDWLDAEVLGDWLLEAEDAATEEDAKITVDAMDLVRLLDEVRCRREEDLADE
jgi:hypothetical protein